MPRSDPLIIDGETGEPTNLPFTALTHEPWKVLVVDLETNQRRSKKFFSYVEAKQAAADLSEKYRDTHKVGVVSRQVGYGPPYSKVSDEKLLQANENGYWWCPYCRAFRDFHFVPYLDQRWCEFCHTREKDFHVARCNPILWSPDHLKRRFGNANAI